MKKIFTFAVAVLASVSLWADDATFTMSSIFDGTNQAAEVTTPVAASVSTNTTKGNAKDGKLGSDGHYFQIVLAEASFSAASMNGYINTSSIDGKNWAFQFSTDGGETWSEEATQANDGTKTAHDIAVSVDIPSGANGFRVVRRAGTSTVVNSITLTLGAVAPVVDPVTTVTISGDAAGYVGKSVTLTASTDVKADSLYWTVDGAVQDDSNSKTFTLALEAARTYSVVCFARNQYNEADKFAASEAFKVVATEKATLVQVDVTEATVWDWTKAATVKEIKWDDTTTPKKNDEVLLANVDGVNNDANFNSQALLFSGEYPIRDSKYCQGAYIEFNTTVAGYVQVEFSNTGGKVTDGVSDRPKRYVAVNGTVNLAVGSDTGTKVESDYIAVPAGKVNIAGAFEDGTPQYIRIYKITFGVGEIPTAIENTNAAVKATKVIREGQIMIQKGDKLYNALGAEIR